MPLKSIIYVQARTGSSRFPGKVLSYIDNKPYLVKLVQRLRLTKPADDVVIITSNNTQDNEIESICIDNRIPCFRGSETDLLDRHYKANQIYKADIVVKIPSDCPFSDPETNARVINLLKASSLLDYVSNYHPPTFPDGLDVEAFTAEALAQAWTHSNQEHEREHTTPYIWDQPEKYNIGNIVNPLGDQFMTHRWTLDYPEDMQFIQTVYRELNYATDFPVTAIHDLLSKKPHIGLLNSRYNGVNWYGRTDVKLRTVDPRFIKTDKNV